MRLSYSRHRHRTMTALALVVGAISAAVLAPSSAVGSVSPLTDPHKIEQLAAHAYVWGLPAEFVYRFGNYSTLVTAPRNTLGGGKAAAAWNNNGTNAGDASVLYLNAMIDLSGAKGRSGTKELVLTVPPSRRNYYVANLLDDFINTVASIGTRTTPSTHAQTYLLAGPTSRYAHKRIARIHGFTYRVVPYDTNLGWILIRIRADTLLPATDRASAASIQKNVVERFAMSTLAQFEAQGHRPNYFEPNQYTPTRPQQERAKKWQNAPTHAVAFFKQMGESLRRNPLPDATTGLNGIPLPSLPTWIAPQYRATRRYRNPSYPQRHTLAEFKPLGLTASGFRIPSNWGPRQEMALQNGYEDGQARVNRVTSTVGAKPATNFWSYLNTIIGTYPNTLLGYLYRAAIVLEGGSANVPLDGVYAQINNLDGTPATQLDGNNTYKLTFTPPVTRPDDAPGHRFPAADGERQPGQSSRILVDSRLPDRYDAVSRPVHHSGKRPEHRVLDREHSRDRRGPVDRHDHRSGLRLGPADREYPDPVRLDRSTVRSHTGRSVLRRDDADTADRPSDQCHNIRLQGVDHLEAATVPSQRPDARRQRYGHPRARSSS